jgi:hypothetical protein
MRLYSWLLITLISFLGQGCVDGFRVISARHKLAYSSLESERRKQTQPLSLNPPLLTNQSTLTRLHGAMDDGELPLAVPVVLVIAIGLFVAAQGWINSLAAGDQGLGAFLQDGRGFKGSKFQLSDKERAVSDDPLPWLKLPKFDFVDVAGQEQDIGLGLEQLERLRLQLNESLEKGDTERAEQLRLELEQIMSNSQVEFKND